MSKDDFKAYVEVMVDNFGVSSYLNNITDDMTPEEIDEDLWFECPICGEPILYLDYGDDTNLSWNICPVCEEGFYEDDGNEIGW